MQQIIPIATFINATELRIAEQAEINKFSTLKNKLGSYLSQEDHAENTRIWYKNNREKVLQNQRKWCKNNPEKILEKHRQYRESNREAINENQRKYRLHQKQLKEQDQ